MNRSPRDFLRPLQRLQRHMRRLVPPHLRPDDASQDVLTVLCGHAVRLLLGLASSAMLARGLGPEGLSVFSVVSATMLIAISLGDFGLSNSAVRYLAADLLTAPARARETARTLAALKLLGSAGVVVGGLAFAAPLVALLGLPAGAASQLLPLAALGVMATALSGVIAAILRALRRFAQLVAAQTLNVALTVVLLGVLFLLERLTIATALLVGALTAAAAAFVGWLLLPSAWRQALRVFRRPFAPQAGRLWRFGRWLWLSNLLVIALSQLDLLLLNRWASAEATGHYALALNLAIKAAVLNQTLHVVLLPNVSALSGWREFTAYARRSLRRSVLLGAALLLALPFAPPFIQTVYGAQFLPSVPLFYLLATVVLFEILVDPLLMLAYPLDMPRHIAAAQALRLAILLLAGSLTIPIWGGAGAALSKLAAHMLGALFLGSLLLLRLRQVRRNAAVDAA